MNKSILALACALVLGGLFVQDAEARHHHRDRWRNNNCGNNWSAYNRYNNGWGNRGWNNGWGNRRYNRNFNNWRYNNGYNGNLSSRILNWR